MVKDKVKKIKSGTDNKTEEARNKKINELVASGMDAEDATKEANK